MACFLLNGKKEILFTYTKIVTSQKLKITAYIIYFRSVIKFLKDTLLTKCLTFHPLINLSLKTSPVSSLVIPLSTNCYQLPTKFLHLLITDSRLEIISWTCIKLLIKSGTKGLFLNWNKTAFLVNYFTSYLIVEAIGMLREKWCVKGKNLSRIGIEVSSIVIHKIWETNSSFHVKCGKVLISIFQQFFCY